MKRRALRLSDQLAAALACLLPKELREELRQRQAPTQEVRALFEMDHIVLHAQGGSDEWWNLDPKLKAVHREKSRRDTGIVAKGKRIERKWQAFMSAVAKGRKPPKRKSKWQWGKRCVSSRRRRK